jgi:predicted permease
MTKLLFTLGVITVGLSLGYTTQRMAASGRLPLPLPIADLRRLLQKIGLLFFMYFSFMATVWIIRIDNLRLVTLPVLGIFILLLGGGLALGGARMLKLSRRQTGSYFACGSFSNIGSIGALVVFVFLDEEAFAYVPLYKLFEEVFYFTVGFPIAKYFSPAGETATGETTALRLKRVFSDIFVIAALASITIGGGLNLAGVERPEIFGTLNAAFIPTGTFILLTSIGMAMRFSSIGNYIRECTAIAGIKFVALPVTACLIAYSAGLGFMHDGLPLKVVLILSSAPVAFTALIPPSIYDLDLDLSNACWLSSTLALFGVLPIVYLLIQHL